MTTTTTTTTKYYIRANNSENENAMIELTDNTARGAYLAQTVSFVKPTKPHFTFSDYVKNEVTFELTTNGTSPTKSYLPERVYYLQEIDYHGVTLYRIMHNQTYKGFLDMQEATLYIMRELVREYETKKEVTIL